MVISKNIESTPIISDGDDDFEEFSPLEETIVRVRDGVPVDEHAPLKRKSENEAIKNRLLELEQEIIKRARIKGII